MKIIHSIQELRKELHMRRFDKERISFVPTMGNLHEGHISLIHKAAEKGDCVVASIFVNPLQFGANEDLESYPRTPEEDEAQLLATGSVDYLFRPRVEEIYPVGQENHTVVEVPNISDVYCGASRPGHFRGVATIVCKLLNIVQPDFAIFGRKDYQQLMVIEKMVEDLCLPVKVIGADTARAQDGLALSSRNGYLTQEERDTAPALYKALVEAREAIIASQADFKGIQSRANHALEQAGFKPDYFDICNAKTLEPALRSDQELVILAAAYLGKARLIDNMVVSLSTDQDSKS
ncbi:pantoate--beta-alanine ligase [Litoribrevibacter euphylliae]|uniref:Pantothenate synthetase n=1 Tax=Litoribrevibacter euphylliae TaxID=1834034 RepID=A0ABV7HHS3_9GAMM